MKKMFKDPKVTIVSCKDFLYNTNFLRSCTNKLNTNETPEPYISYYDISSKYLTEIIYGIQWINYGRTSLINLYKIKVAIRNGVEEYECFFEDLAKLKEQCAKMPNSEKYKLNYNNMLKNIRYIKKNLPVFEKNKPLDDSVSIDELSKKLYEMKASGADIKYIVNEAHSIGYERAGIFEKMENKALKNKDIENFRITNEDINTALKTFALSRNANGRRPIGFTN